jgi:intracellular multiplication protein IcmE
MKKISFALGVTTFLTCINAISANPNSTFMNTVSITFATLNTVVNSDQPNHLIDATIIDGTYKGSKLHGKIITAKSESGETDRITLNFTSMDMRGKSKSIKISAYAIDANTARTALAGKVSSEYLQHNGAILAASFLQSYAQDNDHSLQKVKIDSDADIGVLFMPVN